MSGDTGRDQGLFQGLLRRVVGPKPLAAPYHAFTSAFDREIEADHIDDVIGAPTPEDAALLNLAWREMQTGLLPWRTRLLVAAGEASARIRAASRPNALDDTIIALLLDHSGSMRGQKMLYAAATADLAQEFLSALGVGVEVLGFTTSRWRGGRSRTEWVKRGRPDDPGRLNDLLHIVYRAAGDRRASLGDYAYRAMLRPDLLKENVDGEAVLWAVDRLRRQPQTRKVLLVLSDGAPVDDSTLEANTLDYLSRHLAHVVGDLAASGDVEIAALGIGFDVRAYYPNAAHAADAINIGAETLALLERLLTTPPTKT